MIPRAIPLPRFTGYSRLLPRVYHFFLYLPSIASTPDRLGETGRSSIITREIVSRDKSLPAGN